MLTTAVAPAHAVVSDRVAGFDLLRGACAIAVVIYHTLTWNNQAHLYNLGTYAVYIFFALSGASMYVAYAERFEGGYGVGRFLALRFIRLAPLYVIGMLLAASYRMYKGEYTLADGSYGLVNALFVFGLGNPGASSQVAGGWSIGIEFVFYLVFPVMLALTASRHWLLFLLLAFVAQHAFVNTTLNNGQSLAQNFNAYTQFLAFIFYFAGGCAIGRALRERRLPSGPLSAGLLVACIAGLATTSGITSEYSLTGVLGMTLSLVAVGAVALSATLQAGLFLHRVSDVLGRASYGVYILHPWVWAVVNYAGRKVGADPVTIAVATVAASVPVALVVERWLEKPLQKRMKAALAR